MNEKAMDPVCGMEIEERKICSEHKGKKYCFCSEECKKQFEENPEKYVGGQEGGGCH